MVDEASDELDKTNSFYEFWTQFSEQFMEDEAVDSSGVLPVDLSPYMSALELDLSAFRHANFTATHWELAKAISAAAMPKVKKVCEVANQGSGNQHQCPSQEVCNIVDSEEAENQIPALAAALLIPQNLGGGQGIEYVGNSARLLAAKADAPYYIVYHWMNR